MLLPTFTPKCTSKFTESHFLEIRLIYTPNPAYNVSQFIDNITKGLEAVITQYPAATLFVLSDFNELDTNF